MDIVKDLFYAQRALVTLFSVANKLQMQGDKQLQDLTIRQMLAIPALIHAPDGKATLNYLARSLGTTKQNAKQIVDAMQRKGYLSVAPSDQDKRAVHISITPDGQHAFGICSGRTDVFLADIFNGFTTDELETFCALLQKLYRFDSIAQEGAVAHAAYDPSTSESILKHHPQFASHRTNIKEHG